MAVDDETSRLDYEDDDNGLPQAAVAVDDETSRLDYEDDDNEKKEDDDDEDEDNAS